MKSSSSLDTLDERVLDSVLRDLRVIAKRARLVALPCRCTLQRGISLPEAQSRAAQVQAELHDWDLWGPLLVCLALSATLSAVSKNAPSTVFSLVFVIIWIGGVVVTLNASLLGGRLSLFQSVCLLGYAVTPLLLAAVCCLVWHLAISSGAVESLLRFLTVIGSLVWSLSASSALLTDTDIPQSRKLLAQFPVVLLFCGISWVILIAFE
jgi:uncharacterized integral membrane protein